MTDRWLIVAVLAAGSPFLLLLALSALLKLHGIVEAINNSIFARAMLLLVAISVWLAYILDMFGWTAPPPSVWIH